MDANKLDVFYAAGRLTDEQYTELMALLNGASAVIPWWWIPITFV